MRLVRLTATLLLSTCAALPTFAYVEPVHEAITRRAFDRAIVDLQARLGISSTAPIAGALTPRQIMTLGSRDEDANARALAHFYDPVHEVALTLGKSPVCGPALFSTRTDHWATDPSATNSRNVPEARKHYSAAVIGPNPGTRAVHQKELFYSLGHLVHLVQDMAQPEHTRNDVHLILSGSAAFLNGLIAALVGERMPSLYEAWALENVAGQNPLVSLDGYPNLTLPDYASYFHTLDGRGLADYANRNFLTQDTNYGDYSYIDQLPCFKYSSPFQSAAMVRIEPEVAYALRRDDGSCCYIQTVQDEAVYTWRTSDGEFDDFHSHHSSLDLETKKYDPNASFYSLSDGSYQRRAELLIPRAVGYSAGFIEHFFRGKIDAKWKRTSPGAVFSHELTITNRSPEKIGADAKISAGYRADPSYFGQSGGNDTGTVFANAELSQFAPGFSGLAPGESVTFTIPQIAGLKDNDSINGFERRIVINGSLGTEQNAVIGLVQPKNASKLHVEVTWDNPYTVNSLSATYWPPTSVRQISSYGGNDLPPDHPFALPNSTGNNPPDQEGALGPLTITINPMEEGKRYWFSFDSQRYFDYSSGTTVSVKVFIDDVLMSQIDVPVQYFNSSQGFASLIIVPVNGLPYP